VVDDLLISVVYAPKAHPEMNFIHRPIIWLTTTRQKVSRFLET
jgi:hypothetical protein